MSRPPRRRRHRFVVGAPSRASRKDLPLLPSERLHAIAASHSATFARVQFHVERRGQRRHVGVGVSEPSQSSCFAWNDHDPAVATQRAPIRDMAIRPGTRHALNRCLVATPARAPTAVREPEPFRGRRSVRHARRFHVEQRATLRERRQARPPSQARHRGKQERTAGAAHRAVDVSPAGRIPAERRITRGFPRAREVGDDKTESHRHVCQRQRSPPVDLDASSRSPHRHPDRLRSSRTAASTDDPREQRNRSAFHRPPAPTDPAGASVPASERRARTGRRPRTRPRAPTGLRSRTAGHDRNPPRTHMPPLEVPNQRFVQSL